MGSQVSLSIRVFWLQEETDVAFRYISKSNGPLHVCLDGEKVIWTWKADGHKKQCGSW